MKTAWYNFGESPKMNYVHLSEDDPVERLQKASKTYHTKREFIKSS